MIEITNIRNGKCDFQLTTKERDILVYITIYAKKKLYREFHSRSGLIWFKLDDFVAELTSEKVLSHPTLENTLCFNMDLIYIDYMYSVCVEFCGGFKVPDAELGRKYFARQTLDYLRPFFCEYCEEFDEARDEMVKNAGRDDYGSF